MRLAEDLVDGAVPVVTAKATSTSVYAFAYAPGPYAVIVGFAAILGADMVVSWARPDLPTLGLVALVVLALAVKARPLVWAWTPFVAVGVMFLALAPVGQDLARHAHEQGPISFDRLILGGAVAPVWLQSHIGGSGVFVAVLTAVLVTVYLSHFVAGILGALGMWLRHRHQFIGYATVYLLAMALGFLVYLVYPQMPPWLASEHGLLPPLHRIAVDVLHQVGLGSLYAGADPEPYGAMPSLHVTVPVVIALTFIRAHRWRGFAWLWLIYPATAFFAVLYLGEHYLIDSFAGIVVGVIAFVSVFAVARQQRFSGATVFSVRRHDECPS